MKIIEKPNKDIIKLLERISESDAIGLYKIVGDEWDQEYFTDSLTFADFKVWIKNKCLSTC